MKSENLPSIKHGYSFQILTQESVIVYLKSLGYNIVEVENASGCIVGENRYEEQWQPYTHTFALKGEEKPQRWVNELDVVFHRELEKSLLKLLLAADLFDEKGELKYLKDQ